MDKHAKLMLDIELLYSDWCCKLSRMIREDTQPTRETLREFIRELRKVYSNNIDWVKTQADIQELLDYANMECE